MTREQLETQLQQMLDQERDLQEQLLMTRGAVQVLQHLLAQDTDGAAQVAPDETEG